VDEPKRRQRFTPKGRVPVTRRSLDGQLGVFQAAIAVFPRHDADKAEVNRRHQRVVPFSFRERLAEEVNGFAPVDNQIHRASQPSQDSGPRITTRRRLACILEQGDCAATVTSLAVTIGAVEDAPAQARLIVGRRKPHGQLE
jgi:hypothetical protein